MAPIGLPEFVYVSIVGKNQITVSASVDTAISSVHEMVHSVLSGHITDAKNNGDMRESISIRTCYVELRK